MSFDEIFDLTAGVYFNFYNIYIYRSVRGPMPHSLQRKLSNFRREFDLTEVLRCRHLFVWDGTKSFAVVD